MKNSSRFDEKNAQNSHPLEQRHVGVPASSSTRAL